jgi:hypothetical protein
VRIADYLKDIPLLHTWDGGETWTTGGFMAEHLQKLLTFLQEHAPEDSTMLETGAGNTTIALLLLQPRSLVSICPDQPLVDRIRGYCDAHGVDTRRWTPHVDGSEWVLPKLADLSRATGPAVDFALIDGCHNWPMVFVDFCYIHYLLKRGGHLMLDDLHLHSVKELGRLLVESEHFRRALDLGKAVVLEKRSAERSFPDWAYQPYIARRTREHERAPNPFAID